MITGKYKTSIVVMTIGNLYSALYTAFFHLFYIIVNFTNTPVDFYICSFLRRFAVTSYCPISYGCLLVALDRFFAICLDHRFPLLYHMVLQIPFLAVPIWLLYSHMTSNRVMMEDICGPTLLSENTLLADMTTYILIVYPLVALIINCLILIFITRSAKRMRTLGLEGVNKVKTRRQITFGMILQSILPICSQLPMVTSALLYFRGHFVPQLVWDFNNVIFHIGLTLNPVITVIFVKQFRLAVLKYFNLYSATAKVTIVALSRSVKLGMHAGPNPNPSVSLS
ncbi:hypothetical protein L596_019596 [Steinernema carpocapsae]|uniref:G-protein coupled receptors family 1 profile domain-containing protein n=1 Tax=Steinernema carpocapsae TaxID=34508 RepID=A0A4U5MRH5_STECR|nr:hypothetical protein L596_019596 [Steinernema carpocapsae]